MTPKEHFCHSRLVVPAQTSKAREGTHHLLGCQVSQGGVNRSAIAPPKQHGVFQAFWRSHFPDFTTLHQGIVRSKPPQGTASVLWSFHVCFMSLKHPRPLLGTPQNSAPPKKKYALRNCWVLLGVATSVTTSLKAKGACSTGLFTSTATKYENESNGQNGRKALWNHMKSTDFPVGLKKTICWKFCVKESNIINVWIPFQPCVTWVKPQTLPEVKVAPSQVSWASPRRMLQESPSREVSYIFSMIGTTRSQGNIERVGQKDK